MAERIIAGTVEGDGIIRDGVGFTAERTGKGRYNVTFDPPFTGFMGASVTQISDGNTRANAGFVSVGNSVLKVKTGDGNGDVQDRPFTFIASGT